MTSSVFNPEEHGHRRYNPLTDQWILISPHRLSRPWSGKVENVEEIYPTPKEDPTNPLSPGAKRAGGFENPYYESVFSFVNDFSALKPDFPKPEVDDDEILFKMSEARGICKVISYHPKSNMSFGTMAIQDIFAVINLWISETVELGEKYDWVQIFENRGLLMGCSNPHPHGQIWASSYLPSEPFNKNINLEKYFVKHGRPLLLDYVQKEIEKEERIVLINTHWVVLVPFWAAWPYETMVIPRSHIRRIYDMNHDQKIAFSEILRSLYTKYDNLFKVTCPFSMGWHGAPTGTMKLKNMDHWVFHGMFYPPLLRSATVKKFMVGYEMLAETQRDFPPEFAAKTLRGLSDTHFMLL